MSRAIPCAAFGLFLLYSLNGFAQVRTVAITVDDLPYAGLGAMAGASSAEKTSTAETANGKLLAAFQSQHIPVTGFVNQKTVESLGPSGDRALISG
jgi:hypothetical protein